MAHQHRRSPFDPARSGPVRLAERRRLLIALILTSTIMVAEFWGGWISNSLALLSDAGHMLTDVSALLIASISLIIAARPATAKKTYGYYRLEILAALANGVLLTVMAVFITIEAVERFQDPKTVAASTVLAVASVGLTANVIGMLLLARHRRGSLATKGAYLHIIGDTISSVAVIIGALIIQYTGWFIVDPILSVAIAGVIVFASYRLMRECVDVLLQGVPLGLEIDHVRESIEQVDGVLQVHDIHIWTITSGMPTFSCHIKVAADLTQELRDRILTDVKMMLRDRYQIHHSTIQVEGEEWQEVGHVH